MGFFISRQRDGLDNCLYIEIVCGGPKHAGKDILPFKYNSDCDGKNLVSPIDAVAAAERIYKRWQLDYHDEEKRLQNRGPTKFMPVWINANIAALF